MKYDFLALHLVSYLHSIVQHALMKFTTNYLENMRNLVVLWNPSN